MGVHFHRTVKLRPEAGFELYRHQPGHGMGCPEVAAEVAEKTASVFSRVPGSGEDYGANKKNRVFALLEPDIHLAIGKDHRLRLRDTQGQPLSPESEWRLRQNHLETLLELLQGLCDQRNRTLYGFLTLFQDVPLPDTPLSFQSYYQPLKLAGPQEPHYRCARWFERWLPGKRRAIETANHVLASRYRRRQVDWQRQVDRYEYQQRQFWNNRFASAANALEFLHRTLNLLHWPHAFGLRLALDDNLETLTLNARLPAINALPCVQYGVSEHALGLTACYLNAARRQKHYIHYVHGIGVRLIGEVFRAVPVNTVVFSGYIKKATGGEKYLYSTRVSRAQWQLVDFSRLDSLSALELMQGFELRRKMSKTGIFRPIVPIEPFGVDRHQKRESPGRSRPAESVQTTATPTS